ncbi:uncharacterized protein EAF01_005615 [Botrytis porri]|uniref:uncharacterized protein n=1 Tax=Botrytis porri TaxID=87229 RepID=UPI0018FF6FF1|nr:uncharacterized protein EAF01_005615 [Botrytis porri]KAF7905094.1 hypothetical protein EAF01_005615 [Botrytis porri]
MPRNPRATNEAWIHLHADKSGERAMRSSTICPHPATKTIRSPLGSPCVMKDILTSSLSFNLLIENLRNISRNCPSEFVDVETDPAAMNVDASFYTNDSSCYLAQVFHIDPSSSQHEFGYQKQEKRSIFSHLYEICKKRPTSSKEWLSNGRLGVMS